MNSKQSILIVDDDPNVLEVLDARLSSSGFRVVKAGGAHEALQLLKGERVDLMISDVKMPGMGGMDLFNKVRSFCPGLPVIFLTAYGTIPDAVRAVKAGAVDYLAKPFDGRELVEKLNKILKELPLQSFREEAESAQLDFDRLKSPLMKELYDLIERIAESSVNVLILGESGVGKERVARRIHYLGPRRDRPFVVVDCGATPTGLLESELFGHIKGAFTNAIRDKEGLIEAADLGTLFLDEVGNVSHEMQIRLLRFLEERKIRKIGDIREIAVDCRVLAATHSDLARDIEARRFREDLYYRLRVVTLKIPPLRDRKEDILPLALHFLKAFCEKNGSPPMDLHSQTIEWLCKYSWPGNVRELKNALEASAVVCKGRVLHPKDLHLIGLPESPHKALREKSSLSLEESERNTILRALKQAGGIQKEAAKLLGISRRAIHYKIKKYEINSSKVRLKSDKYL